MATARSRDRRRSSATRWRAWATTAGTRGRCAGRRPS
jgi:hypothetical protein